MENGEQADAGQPRRLYPGIESDPEILYGKPVIQGTRLSVELILQNLAAGDSFEDLLDDYPALRREDILAAIGYAAHLAARPPTSPSENEQTTP